MSTKAWRCCASRWTRRAVADGAQLRVAMPANDRTVHPIRTQEDIVRVRQATRERAVAQGLSLVDQTKIVTAASELARNTLDYGGGGEVTIEVVCDGARKGVRLVFVDQGPGIPD